MRAIPKWPVWIGIAILGVLFELWSVTLLGLLLVAVDVWERSPRGKRAAVKKRLKAMDGKGDGLTVRQLTLLYLAFCAGLLYFGGVGAFADLIIANTAGWSLGLHREFTPGVSYAEALVWLALGNGAVLLAVLWVLRFLGYIEKDDRIFD